MLNSSTGGADLSSNPNTAANVRANHPYAIDTGAQPPSAWAMDASTQAWLGGGNRTGATAPTSSVSTPGRPAALSLPGGSGPGTNSQGTYLSQMPLPNMAIPAGARVTGGGGGGGTASPVATTSAAAEAAAANAATVPTDAAQLQQASSALRSLMADHAHSNASLAPALAVGAQQQQQSGTSLAPPANNASLAHGEPVRESGPDTES